MTNNSILVAGVGGRMGRAIASEILRTPNAELAGGFERQGAPDLGKDIGVLTGGEATGLMVQEGASSGVQKADVLIDFTAPQASIENAALAAETNTALVLGTTGFSAEEEAALREQAKRIAIVKSGNMSLGVNLLTVLVEQAASSLGIDFDIEIFEAHHRHKADAPSGTALMLGEAAAQGRGGDLDAMATGVADGRQGVREKGDIGFSVIRGGGIIGDHEVSFASEQEVLTLSHHAIDRTLFAKGAVAAALWVADKKTGLYSMRDVLGINQE